MERKEIIPWMEKYRPSCLKNIVLNETNKLILNNIIDMGHFPNLIFFGPPGTGKTTTIINLIEEYQKKNNIYYKDLTIHLNASDERGIDTIRSQIQSFACSKTMFNHGTKFVILDEVDYMTKSAQQALKILINSHNNNIKYCLICNYIHKIEEELQNEFIHLRFDNLPKKIIQSFISNISVKEDLNLTEKNIDNLILEFNNDIRSMINYLQNNEINLKKSLEIKQFNEEKIKKITILLKEKKKSNKDIETYLLTLNDSVKSILIKYLKYYVLTDNSNIINNYTFLKNMENFIRMYELSNEVYISLFRHYFLDVL